MSLHARPTQAWLALLLLLSWTGCLGPSTRKPTLGSDPTATDASFPATTSNDSDADTDTDTDADADTDSDTDTDADTDSDADADTDTDTDADTDSDTDSDTDADPAACATDGVVSGLGIVAQGTTCGQGNDTPTTCGGLFADVGPEVVYTWTAPAAGTYTFDTSGSSVDTVLELREPCPSGSVIACNDQGGIGGGGRITRTLAANETVLIAVDSFLYCGSYALGIWSEDQVWGACELPAPVPAVLSGSYCWSPNNCYDVEWTLHHDGSFRSSSYTGIWVYDCAGQLDLIYDGSTTHYTGFEDAACYEGTMTNGSGEGTWDGCITPF